jgi:methyltransferase (TIGR00027 family)
MIDEKGSSTAKGVSVLRAVHQLIDGDYLLLNDPIIVKLLGDEIKNYILQNKDRFYQPEMMTLRSHIVLRSRYAEDCLEQAYYNGVRQFIILGAGMDTFAYRQPVWAHDIHIVEADHPASQAAKILSLQNAGISIPENLSFVRVDLESDDLSAIFNESVLDPNKPVLISCLGVLVYLSARAIEKIFEFAGSLPPNSEFIFTVTQKRDKNQLTSPEVIAALEGEPWISHFEQDTLVNLLKESGFRDISYLTTEEAKRLYFSNGQIKLEPPEFSSIVRAVN